MMKRLSPELVEVTKVSPITKKPRTKQLAITEKQWQSWQSGTLIQFALPHLSVSDREFLITGMDDEDWDAMLAGGEPNKNADDVDTAAEGSSDGSAD